MRWSSIALAAVLAVGCSEENSAPSALPFDTLPQCPEGAVACVNAGVSSFEVDGVRVIHRRVEGHPLVAMHLHFDGAPEARADQYWAESLALGVFESTGPRRLPYPEWIDRLADMSASVSVSTRVDYHTIWALAPRPRWRALWHLLMEALQEPYLAEYFLDHERAIREYAFTSEQDEPDSAAAVAAFSRLFRGQAYNVPREHRARLASVSTGDLAEAWRSLRVKRRLLVVMVGDVTEHDARDAVRDELVTFPAEHSPSFLDHGDWSELAPAEKVVVLDYPDSPTWYLRSYFKGPTPHAVEYAALRLGLKVLGQRLFDRVRDAQGLAYSTGATSDFG
jgi:predicted Zn-dependent peptidase